MEFEHYQKIARMTELVGRIKREVAELAASKETKPNFLELIQLLSEHINDPEVLQIIEELLASETDDEIIQPTFIAETSALDLSKQETDMPYYTSVESLDAEIESAREIFGRDLQEAFAAANAFTDYLLEKIKTKKEQHPENVVKETQEKGLFTFDDGGTMRLPYDFIHHKPEEEVLGAALRLWGTRDRPQADNPIIEDPYKPGGKKYTEEKMEEKLDGIHNAQNSQELVDVVKDLFYSGTLHDLLRMQLFITTYYPDNKDYEKLLKPIGTLLQTLKNLGFEIKTVPPLTEVTNKDSVSTNYNSYTTDVLKALPTVFDKVSQKVEEAREGKKIAIDVSTFGFEHRFIKNTVFGHSMVGDNSVNLLTPGEWSGGSDANPRSRWHSTIY